MKLIQFAIVACLSAGSTAAFTTLTSEKDPRAIFKLAGDTGKRLKSVKYTTTSTFRKTKSTSTIIQKNDSVPDSGFAKGKYYVKGEAATESEGIKSFEFGYDGRSLRVRIDGGQVRVLENPQPYEVGQQLPFESVGVTIPIIGDFAEVLAKEKPEMKYIGVATIGKWKCDLVEVKRKVSHPAIGETVIVTQWAFDQASHLPVQVKGTTGTTTATSLQLDLALDDKVFQLQGEEVKANRLGPATDDLLPLGSQAPDFTLVDGTGKKRSLKEFRGKVVLIDFWGTWCTPCHKLMPILQGLHNQYQAKGLRVLGVAVGDKEADPVAFMKRNKYSYGVLLGGDSISKTYKARLLPTFYLIDKKGKIAYRQAGINKEDKTRLPKLVQDVLRK